MALGDKAILERSLSSLERGALRAFADALRERFGPRLTKLAVFGSRARADEDEDSDIDIVVVIDAATEAEHEAVIATAAALRRHGGGYTRLSPLVLSTAEHAELVGSGRRIARDIEREGIAV